MIRVLLALAICSSSLDAQQSVPGSRTVMDAHNCYPYFEWWGDRIDRALSAGTPLAIEQDLAWHTDPKTGRSWSVVTHGEPTYGTEPTMDEYFFKRVRPIVEKALRDGNHGDWPLITLNLDFKDNKPEHLAAVLELLRKYQPWLTTSVKVAQEEDVQPLDVKPILVLTGEADAQQTVFYDQLQTGDHVLLFGAIHTEGKEPSAAPEIMDPMKATNYRRWWNNSWFVVEEGGQKQAGNWTADDDRRLRALVEHAHRLGYWIRFYTLDGFAPADDQGWDDGYNFGSREAVLARWKAALAAGVNFIATDQYEDLGAVMKMGR